MQKKLAIGIVCYPTTGGSGVVATELGKGLAQRGHSIHFITHGLPSRISHFDDNLFLHKVTTPDYPLFERVNPSALSIAVKIREVADQFHLDIVHVHYAIPYAACAYLAQQMLHPKRFHTVTTLHGTDITLVGQMPSFYEITRFSVAVSDGITAVSQFLKDETIKVFHIEQPIEVIHNFIDCNEFRPVPNMSIRKRLAPQGEKIIMHASNFRKVKNLPVIINVFYKVQKEIPCRLVLIGDGPELEPTERLCAELGISGLVTFMGEKEYIADILPAADLFILPSAHESFGLSALEAMSCGVPVVASNIGGLHEVVDHGVTGFLCNPNDSDCMAEIVKKLLRDEAQRKEMGMRGRERARLQFGKDGIIDQYNDLYDRLLETG